MILLSFLQNLSMKTIDNFFTNYKTLKREWATQINSSSQGVIKTVMNQMIFQQHLDSFEPSEFGELSDFAGLQDALTEQNKNEIVTNFDDLYQALATFETILQNLKQNIDQILELKPNLVSAPSQKLKEYLDPLYEAYTTEFEMRKGIIEDITSGLHLNSPYDVIVTVTAAWSGMPFTNDRALERYEKFLDLEASACRTSKLR